MKFTFLNGTARQKQWVHDAIAACQYPLHVLGFNVKVEFTQLTACQNLHTYMCTNYHGGGTEFTIQIESWADDPKNTNNLGLADPNRDLHEFFIDSFVHEIGHIWQGMIPGSLDSICACFTHIPDGRRGTAADYEGTEITQNQWSELIKEALSEWFRLAYLPERQVYGNRTRWTLNPPDFKKLYSKTVGFNVFEYDKPVDCQVVLSFKESGTELFPNGSAYETAELGPITFGDLNDPVFVANPSWPWDFDHNLTNQYSGVALKPEAWPTIFHSAERMLLSFSNFGQSSFVHVPGDPPGMLVFDPAVDDWQQPPDFLDALLNPHQPAFGGHAVPGLGFGFPIPALQDQVSTSIAPQIGPRSGWKVGRSVRIEVDLPSVPRPGTGWGVLELTLLGQAVEREAPFASLATAEYGVDANGNILSVDDQFAGAPWGTSLGQVIGAGAFADNPAPPQLHAGWIFGCAAVDEVSWWTASNGYGRASVLKAVGHRYQSPGDIVPPVPDPPCSSSYTEFGEGGSSILHEFIPSVGPVESFQDGNARVIAPRRQKQMFVGIFSGFAQQMDPYTGLGVRARYFPVKAVAPTTPVPKPLDPGRAVRGPMQGGSVRSKKDIALARRALQVVERVGGGIGQPRR